VATAAHEAWLGATPTEPLRELTEAVFEDFQLGLSIHRREQA
jgi:hypothetical protein